MTQLSNWSHATTDIPDRGLARVRSASEAERGEIARALKLASLDKLVANYRITSISGGGWRLAGHLEADVVQSCIVSLEPVPAHIEEAFDVEFWQEAPASDSGGDLSVLQGPDMEPFDGHDIAVGRIVFETLAAALDPYPRKDNASFNWAEPDNPDEKKTSPFAVLAKLKGKE
jgi:uncharacterized metal-binding protein YceD (DUF177 family)